MIMRILISIGLWWSSSGSVQGWFVALAEYRQLILISAMEMAIAIF
jgi:hypothetical protein